MSRLYEDNQELRDKRFPIPDGVRKHLAKTLASYDGDKTVDGYKRLNNLLSSEGVSYRDMKRIKNFFDTYVGTNKSADYILNGGDTMKWWVENTLGRARKTIDDFKRAKKDAGIDNAYIKPHEKERQHKKNKPTTTKFHTSNRNSLEGNTIKYESKSRTGMTNKVHITEAELRGLIHKAINEAFEGYDNDLDYETVNMEAYDYLTRYNPEVQSWRSIADALGFRMGTIGPNDMETLKDAIEDAMADYDGGSYNMTESELLTDSDDDEFDSWSISDELDRLGWSYSNAYEVTNRETEQTGVRYELVKDRKDAADEETLKNELTNKIGSEKVIFSKGTHRYAPEITRLSMIVLD